MAGWLCQTRPEALCPYLPQRGEDGAEREGLPEVAGCRVAQLGLCLGPGHPREEDAALGADGLYGQVHVMTIPGRMRSWSTAVISCVCCRTRATRLRASPDKQTYGKALISWQREGKAMADRAIGGRGPHDPGSQVHKPAPRLEQKITDAAGAQEGRKLRHQTPGTHVSHHPVEFSRLPPGGQGSHTERHREPQASPAPQTRSYCARALPLPRGQIVLDPSLLLPIDISHSGGHGGGVGIEGLREDPIV